MRRSSSRRIAGYVSAVAIGFRDCAISERSRQALRTPSTTAMESATCWKSAHEPDILSNTIRSSRVSCCRPYAAIIAGRTGARSCPPWRSTRRESALLYAGETERVAFRAWPWQIHAGWRCVHARSRNRAAGALHRSRGLCGHRDSGDSSLLECPAESIIGGFKHTGCPSNEDWMRLGPIGLVVISLPWSVWMVLRGSCRRWPIGGQAR